VHPSDFKSRTKYEEDMGLELELERDFKLIFWEKLKQIIIHPLLAFSVLLLYF
jgi:hypothetical protein